MSHLIMNNIRSAVVSIDHFEIPKGELAVLIGPSGAGKSSLLNILAGFLPHKGEVRLAGRPVHDLPPHRRRIGYLFQDLYLFPHMTVFQNLKIAMQSRGGKKAQVKKQVSGLLDLFRISDLAQSYPGQISGGEKQRVAMARAIACRPDLLLLDEPLSHLDYLTARYLRSEFLQIHKKFNLTTLFVTHDLTEAEELGDRILVMETGRLKLKTFDPGSAGPAGEPLSKGLKQALFQNSFAHL